MTDKKAILSKLNKNLNILKEREAKYGGSAPLDLLNQIEDHEQAITLTRQVITGEVSEEEWEEALKSLLLAINNGQVVNIEADTYVTGDVQGDIVTGDKIITVTYETPPSPLPPAEAKERRELGILLNKVKQFWIEGVLKKSIYQVALIDLGKETQAEAVAHAWEQVLELPDQSRQTLPPDKKISHIFDEMNRALLILGEPGSGKTITLLQLAQDLIAQAEADETFSHPVPVVFNLSSWLDKRQPLIDWMVAELIAKYQIPKRIGRPWLENNRLLPLLDGLDEVKPENQGACVEAINQFGAEFGLAGLVVCSRLKEYTRLPVRLKLNGAIRLQPLTLEQIYDYLGVAGSKLDALRSTLQSDDSLREMAQSPLILGIMSLAYQDVPLENMTQESLNTPEKRRKHLFETYIERMFRRKGHGDKPFADRQTERWLSWLARGMRQHNQAIFLIENLQPSWLSDSLWLWLYMLNSRGIMGLIGGLTIGVVDLLFDPSFFGLNESFVVETPYTILSYWLFFGLIVGLLVGFADGFRFERGYGKAGLEGPHFIHQQRVIYILIIGLIFGLIIGLGFGLKGGLFFGLTNGLLYGVIGGLFFGLKGSGQSLTSDIQTVETISWSLGKALKSIPFGLIVGIILGTILGLLVAGIGNETIIRMGGRPVFGLSVLWSAVLINALPYGLIGSLMGAMFGGLYSSISEAKIVPDQGIWLSLRNAFLLGGGFGSIFALVNGIILALISGPSAGLVWGLFAGICVGTLAAFWYGGLEVIKHFTLTSILWYKGHIPRRYIHFLDYAAERVFLQRVGGGYIFVHRMLMEHFATMNIEKKQFK